MNSSYRMLFRIPSKPLGTKCYFKCTNSIFIFFFHFFRYNSIGCLVKLRYSNARLYFYHSYSHCSKLSFNTRLISKVNIFSSSLRMCTFPPIKSHQKRTKTVHLYFYLNLEQKGKKNTNISYY